MTSKRIRPWWSDSTETVSGISGAIHIPFHIDWQNRTISISNVSLNFDSGSATLNLTGGFQPSLLEAVGKIDRDQDGVPDSSDNCPQDANADQADHTAPSITLATVNQQTSCASDVITVGLPTVSDRCSLGGPPQVTGAVIQTNGVPLAVPVPVAAGGQFALPPGTHVVRWTAKDPQGNASTVDQTVQLLPCLAAATGLKMSDRSRIESPSGAPVQAFNLGSELFDVGVEARVGSITSKGSVTLRDRSRVGGSIRTGGTLTRPLNQVTITGTVAENVSLVLPALPAITATWPQSSNGPISLEPNQQRPISPGSYGAVTIKSGAKLILSPGTYFFTSLDVEPQGRILTSGATTLDVRDSMIFRGAVIALDSSPAPTALRYRGTATLFLEAGWYGSVLAPSALVVIGGAPNATFRGQLFANKLEVRPDIVLRIESPTSGGILQALAPQ